MPRSRAHVLIWLVVAALIVAISLPMYGPMQRAWRCVGAYDSAPTAEAELVEELADGQGVYRLVEGPDAGQTCTIASSDRVDVGAEPGQRLDVAYLEGQPGECIPVASLHLSRVTLWSVSIGLGLLYLVVILLGVVVHRSFVTTGTPLRRFDGDPSQVICPGCGGKMAEGYLATLSGIHWRDAGQPIGLPHALGGLPGTVSMRRRPMLHAFHCAHCEVVSFQYGRP